MTTLVFIALRLTGDPAMMLLPGNPTLEDIRLAHEKLGMDQPILTQYLAFVRDAFSGHFGVSFQHGVDAVSIVLDRLPATALLAARRCCWRRQSRSRSGCKRRSIVGGRRTSSLWRLRWPGRACRSFGSA